MATDSSLPRGPENLVSTISIHAHCSRPRMSDSAEAPSDGTNRPHAGRRGRSPRLPWGDRQLQLPPHSTTSESDEAGTACLPGPRVKHARIVRPELPNVLARNRLHEPTFRDCSDLS